MAARATPNANAVVTMRDLEGDLSLLQRVAEFLPIEQLEKSHTVKAVSRAWRTAARRALTRGRWKPLRTLEGCRELICSDASYVDPEARRALKRAAQEAWALYPGEVMLFLLDCVPTYLLKFKFLSLVVESSKQGFGSIVVALEKSPQHVHGSYPGSHQYPFCPLASARQWLHQPSFAPRNPERFRQ